MDSCRVAVFAADNGVVDEGVSCAPRSVTLQQAINMTRRRTGMSAMAAAFGDDVAVVDVGIAADVPGVGILDRKVRRGTGNIAVEDAMTRPEALAAMAAGMEQAARARADSITALGIGEMGIGNTSTSAAVLSALTGADIEVVTGRGGGLTDEGFARKKDVLRRALTRRAVDKDDVLDVLCAVGGLDIAAMAGAFLGCARERIPAAASSPLWPHCVPLRCAPKCGTICFCPTTPMRWATAWQQTGWVWSPACIWECGWVRAAGVPCCSGC